MFARFALWFVFWWFALFSLFGSSWVLIPAVVLAGLCWAFGLRSLLRGLLSGGCVIWCRLCWLAASLLVRLVVWLPRRPCCAACRRRSRCFAVCARGRGHGFSCARVRCGVGGWLVGCAPVLRWCFPL